MSYDVWLKTKPCEHCGSDGKELGEWNYTTNAAPMWNRGIQGKERLQDILHGKTGADALPALERILSHLLDPSNREDLLKLEPDNGWGNLSGCTQFIRDMTEAAKANPKGVFSVWA